jgi:hypothetical protein
MWLVTLGRSTSPAFSLLTGMLGVRSLYSQLLRRPDELLCGKPSTGIWGMQWTASFTSTKHRASAPEEKFDYVPYPTYILSETVICCKWIFKRQWTYGALLCLFLFCLVSNLCTSSMADFPTHNKSTLWFSPKYT